MKFYILCINKNFNKAGYKIEWKITKGICLNHLKLYKNIKISKTKKY